MSRGVAAVAVRISCPRPLSFPPHPTARLSPRRGPICRRSGRGKGQNSLRPPLNTGVGMLSQSAARGPSSLGFPSCFLFFSPGAGFEEGGGRGREEDDGGNVVRGPRTLRGYFSENRDVDWMRSRCAGLPLWHIGGAAFVPVAVPVPPVLQPPSFNSSPHPPLASSRTSSRSSPPPPLTPTPQFAGSLTLTL